MNQPLDLMQLSKHVSKALRHEPELYGINLDNEGWVSLSELVFALNAKGLNIDESRIVEMIGAFEKKRHQILDGKIRALYGHSIDKVIAKNAVEPPEILFHGTQDNKLASIMEKGLLPMERQYVHLSINEETARLVGIRRSGTLIVLKIRAKQAFVNSGIKFFIEENGIWLSEPITPEYIYI